MHTKWWYRAVTVLFILAFVAGMVQPATTLAAPSLAEPAGPISQAEALAKIEPRVLEEIAAEGQTEFFVWMTAKADLSAAKNLRTKLEKGQYVFDTLRATAESTQKGVRAELDAQGVRYRPFYIANKIFVYAGDQALALSLAARPDVAKITPNNQFQLQEPFVEPNPPPKILAVEPNITFINADDVWALGITGEGTVMAGNDTGLAWDHPAIINHYRGWDGVTADHNYNWWDATGAYPMVPNDGHGHGTHITGTMVGDDGGANQIGVAPGAKTIHCKNMTDGGGGSDYTFSTCFEWDLAPWDLSGNNPRPDLAPDAINNSWGYWGGGAPQFEDEIAALQAAGIVVEVSAGNEGPSCGTLRSPGDYAQVLTTGSVNHFGGVLPGTITGFSSRGPSSLYPADFIPDVMAPGEGIRSSLPGGGYASWSGTSMAGPHTTALIGLMWSANPGMQGMVEETYNLIYQTSVRLVGQGGSNCGGDYVDGPNNDWGFGTIDALAAVEAALLFGNPGVLEGSVTDADSGLPIAGVQIQAVHPEGYVFNALTDSAGFYSRVLMEGTYEVTASKYGYLPQTETGVEVFEDQTTVLDFALDPAPSYTVSGTVTDAITGWPLYASIAIGGAPLPPVWTDPVTGEYSVTLVAGMPYTFTVNAWVAGYLTQARTVGPLESDVTEDFALDVDAAACIAPGYEQELFPLYLEDFESGYGNWSMSGLWNPESQADYCGSWVAPFPSPTNASYYGVDGACNFNVGYTTGSLTMLAPVTLPSGMAVFLSFDSFEQTECGGNCSYDKRYIEVSTNGGGSWTTVGEGYQEGAWSNYWLNITAFSGNDLNVRFRFDSVDSIANDYFGWMVDDVALYAAECTPREGSLLVGNVYDANTGLALNAATVAVDDGDATLTYPTPDDDAVDDGFYTVFVDLGEQTVAAAKSGYMESLLYLTAPLFETLQHDFHLDAGWLVADPPELEVDIELGNTLTEPLTLDNLGLVAANFEIFELDRGFNPIGGPAISTMPASPQPPSPAFKTSTAPAGYRPQFAASSLAGGEPLAGTVAVFKDVHAWGVNDVEMFLQANGIPYEVHTSSEFGSLDFSQFGMIVISGDQTQTFYNNYAAHVSKFEDYVMGGGFLNFFACDWGWNGGGLNAPLPGGMNWTGLYYADWNDITDLAHPVVAGVPDPFWGNYASHGYFSNLPAGANVIATEVYTNQPTIVEYPLGAGWLIALAQPLEISHAWGWDAGLIMENSLLWGYAFEPYVDVPWLSESPTSGMVPALDSVAIDVTFDATVVYQPGDYRAELRFINDTPYGPLSVPVTMHVTPPADWGKLEGTVTGLGFCDANPAPLAGALVHVEGQTMSWELETDANGYYQVWMPEDESPVSITITAAEHEEGYADGVVVNAGETTTVDFDLRWLKACFSVDPTSLEAALALGETVTQTLTLYNSGAGEGLFELRERDRGFEPVGMQATTVIVPAGLSGAPAGSAAGNGGRALPAMPGRLYSDSNPPAAGGTTVLIVHADDGDGEPLRSILQSYSDIDVVDVWDARAWGLGTPPLSVLEGYDVVITWSNYYYADRVAMGNVLADYVDGGGYVIQGVFNWSYTTDWGLSGRFVTEGYSPFTSLEMGNHYSYATLGAYDPTHPLMEGVTSASDFYRDYVSLTPGAELVASWSDGEEFVAVKDQVVAINSYPGIYYQWGGDLGIIFHNAVNFLVTGVDVPWLSEDPASGTVPADSWLLIDVTFDASAVTQPGHYMAELIVANNSPGGNFSLPVDMHVTAPPEYGKLEGTVTSLGFCDANPAPLEGVEVTITGAVNSWTVTTNAAGYYSLWLNEAESPLTVHVEPAEHEMGHATGVVVVGQQTTTVDFDLRWLKACISADPTSVEVEVVQGYTLSTVLTLTNDGAAEGTFVIREADGGFTPPAQAPGSGEWLERAAAGVLLQSNQGGEALAFPSAYRWTAGQPSDVTILIYADDYYHGAPNTYVDGALQALGLSYTAYYDGNFSGFESALSGGDWDLVIFANDNYFPPTSTFNALNAYATGGGMLILHTWTLSWDLFNPLWTTLGVSWYQDDWDPPDPVYWWEEDHPVFNDPEQVPEFTALQGFRYGTYGQHVEPLAGFEALAGYTTAPSPNKAALILGNDNRTIFRGFLDGQNDADLDGDGLPDGMELWINMIDGIQMGFASDIPWLTEDPTEGTIDADDSLDVELIFDSTGLALGTYTGTLRISNNNPVGGRLEIPVTMHVLPVEYGVTVDPAEAALSGAPGETVTYQATITNTGNVPDTFTLALHGHTWETEASHATLTLAAGASAVIQVHVTIPAEAEDGDHDTVTATVTSQGDDSKSAAMTMTTTAEIPPPEVFRQFLPIINKNLGG